MKSLQMVIVAVALIGCAGKDGAAGADGKNGSDGVNGANGVNGTNGQDGADNHIVASSFCNGPLQNTTLYFDYSVAVMSSGDVFAYGDVNGGSSQTGAPGYYAASQNGAATAAVVFTGDVAGSANGGWWTIQLNRSTGVTTIVYTDVDVTNGTTTWTMPSSACIVNSYP